GDGRDVGLVELHGGVAVRRDGGGHRRDVSRRLVAQETRVGTQARLREPAEQRVHRNAARFAGQVPQRELHAAHGEHPEATAAPDHQRAMHRSRQVLDPGRIFADQERRESFVHDVRDGERRAVREALAPADEPLVRRDPDEHLLARPRGPRGARRALSHGNRERDRADLSNLHLAPVSRWPIFVKNWSAIIFDTPPSILCPTPAMSPPICTSALYATCVPPAASDNVITVSPRTKPGPPLPSTLSR